VDASKIQSLFGVHFLVCYFGAALAMRYEPNPEWVRIMELAVLSPSIVMIFDFQLKPARMKLICASQQVAYDNWFLTRLQGNRNGNVNFQVFVWTKKKSAWPTGCGRMCEQIAALHEEATGLEYTTDGYLEGLGEVPPDVSLREHDDSASEDSASVPNERTALLEQRRIKAQELADAKAQELADAKELAKQLKNEAHTARKKIAKEKADEKKMIANEKKKERKKEKDKIDKKKQAKEKKKQKEEQKLAAEELAAEELAAEQLAAEELAAEELAAEERRKKRKKILAKKALRQRQVDEDADEEQSDVDQASDSNFSRKSMHVQIQQVVGPAMEKMTDKISSQFTEGLALAHRLQAIEDGVIHNITAEKEARRKKKKKKRKEESKEKDIKNAAKKAKAELLIEEKDIKHAAKKAKKELLIETLRAAASHVVPVTQQLAVPVTQQLAVPEAKVDACHWKIADVQVWLQNVELSQYREIFAERHIDGGILLDLEDQDIAELILDQLHVKKLKRLITLLSSSRQ
jgi:hypothetical protein